MLFAACLPHLRAQQLTTQAPPPNLPDAPYPLARPVLPEDQPDDITLTADTQSTRAGLFTLDGDVVIHYNQRTLQADHIEYDQASGDIVATGHVVAIGGLNQERIEASHGELNLKSQTGRFFDVKGSVGLKTTGRRTVYTNGNPFLFSGRMVVKTGPQTYDIYDGTVTSCQLPHPDWLLSAGRFSVDGERATARNSTFHLLNIPLFYLPYVSHPVDSESRQSGLLIPTFGQSSTKGIILGEQIYIVLNRSTDLTVGAEYFSMRGWSQMATFRFRGRNDDFLRANYSGLLDRRSGAANQGGEDALFSGRRDFTPHTRAVGDVEYLSSFTYRAAFTENFNQAISSDVISRGYIAHDRAGFLLTGYSDRYQGLKRIPFTDPNGVITPGQQVRIFHAPTLNLSTPDRPLGHSGFVLNFDTSAGGLKRVQPNFQTAGIIERFDLRPELAYPLAGHGWHLLPSIAVRDTLYSRSRQTPYGPVPVESTDSVNRANLDLQFALRVPVIERTFTGGPLHRLLRTDFRHTVEPAFTYRFVTGINNFLSILRFDDRDLESNTNELEYGVTQRIFLRPRRTRPCTDDLPEQTPNPLLAPLASGVSEGAGESVEPQAGCGTREWITWRLTQKYFFDPTFGGAIQTGRRNLFDTTLNSSGIAFLTEARNIAPLISRLRVRASEKVDLEWDFDYDTGASRFTADNIFVDVHEGVNFAGFSYARLNAPGRAYNEGISSAVSDFSQMRILLGHGLPTKAGLSIAANAGLDLKSTSVQYAALQTSYNWNCCGLSVEYRKYELGSVRNENAYRFNFTLANIGTAGNLKRAQRLF